MANLLNRLRGVRDQVARWPHINGQPAAAIPEDLEVEGSGIEFVKSLDQMDYIWYRLREREAGREFSGYRVVRLLQLRFLPLEARSDPGLLQKMRTVLRGLYGSHVNFLYLTAGIFDQQPPIGIVQCYGVSAFAPTLDEARADSNRSLSALRAAMAGAYRQIRLEPLSVRIASWIFMSFHDMKSTLITVGHPDPRENAKGSSYGLLRNPLIDASPATSQYTLQQNELLFRGMSDLQEEFLFLVLTSPIKLAEITEMLAGLSENTSTWAAWQQGTRAVSFGVSLPVLLSGMLAQSASQGVSASDGSAHSQGTAQTDGTAHTQGQAHTTGVSDTSGWSHALSTSESKSTGTSATTGQAHTNGQAVTDGSATTDGTSHSSSEGSAATHANSFNWGLNGSVEPAGVGLGGNLGWGTADSASNMSSQTNTTSHAATTSHAQTTSQAETTSQSNSSSESISSGQAETWGTFGSHTTSQATTTSQADTTSQSNSTNQSNSQMQSTAIGKTVGQGISSGLSMGIAPSLSLSNAYQWQFDPAILVTQILRDQQNLLNIASKEGAYYTDVYAMARTEQGKQALMGLISEAFHGTEDVVTGVQTRDLTKPESDYIGLHARAFTPSTRVELVPEVLSGYMDSTILTMPQLAAYTSPGMFEQGTALTVQESTPEFAFFPDMPGDVILGWQWSVETGKLTHTPLRLSSERHFHTAFCGDTGFGKSVAAERLAYETTRQWKFRTIILDFGQGWRKALNWSGLDGRVDIRQLYAGAPRPLRWNILQVPRRLYAGRYRTLICELFANAGRMGPRQLGFMRRALTQVYTALGILTMDQEVIGHPTWGFLQDAREVEVIREWQESHHIVHAVAIHTPLTELQAGEQQALAVWRSQKADVRMWVDRLKNYFASLPKGDQASRASIEGVLLRLEQFSEGQMASQYGANTDSLAVEDLGLLGPQQEPWGLAVVEGGAEMDEYPKVALLALLASILYFDGVVRRRESLAGEHFPPMQIFFEEANKVLTGVSGGAASDQNASSGRGEQVSEIFETFWRDGRKYKIFMHFLAQTVSAMPESILSSSSNGFFFQTKLPKDRDLIMSHIGRSEKGVVNTEYKRYLARIPKRYSIVKLGYSDDVNDVEPMLVQPLMVPGVEPSDQEILERLGAY